MKMKLSDRVNVLMEAKGINKVELERLTGLSHGNVIAITNGDRDRTMNIMATTILALRDALDCTGDYLLGRTEKRRG